MTITKKKKSFHTTRDNFAMRMSPALMVFEIIDIRTPSLPIVWATCQSRLQASIILELLNQCKNLNIKTNGQRDSESK
jgi:hypothetical protein